MLVRFFISLLLLAGIAGTESLAQSISAAQAHQTEWLSQRNQQATGFPFKWQLHLDTPVFSFTPTYAQISRVHDISTRLALKQSPFPLQGRLFIKQHRPQCLYDSDADPIPVRINQYS